jgi:hypothetical protein
MVARNIIHEMSVWCALCSFPSKLLLRIPPAMRTAGEENSQTGCSPDRSIGSAAGQVRHSKSPCSGFFFLRGKFKV